MSIYEQATPRPWEVDSKSDADGPDRHQYYMMLGPDGKSLFDTLNSEVAYLHEDYGSDEDGPYSNVWDEQGRVNFSLVVHAVNNIERLEAENRQMREALEPFVEAANVRLCGADGYWNDDKSIQGTDVAFLVKFGDLRFARATLASLPVQP